MFAEMTNAIKDMAKQGIEYLDKKIDIQLPALSDGPAEVTDAALEERMKAAAYSACNFFNLPGVEVKEGRSIAVNLGNPKDLSDDRLYYNLDQFKDMKCTSFEDMTKVWSHECGHRLLQNIYGGNWPSELGSDFFVGIRSEMLGLPVSDFEKKLGQTGPSESHPGGDLRLDAIRYGRQIAALMMEKGIAPTWDNCLQAFDESPFSRIEYPGVVYGLTDPDLAVETADIQNVEERVLDNEKSLTDNAREVKEAVEEKWEGKDLAKNNDVNFKGFYNDKEWWYKEARAAQKDYEYHTKEAKRAGDRGDFSAARNHAQKAESALKKMEECKKNAERSTK